MTPLERAKAFVKSRAARTALKILPLALAAATAATPAAKADVVINPTNAHFTGCDPNTANCSGLFALVSSNTSFGLLPPAGGVQGAVGSGIGMGAWVGTGTDNTQNWDFVLQGNDTGSTNGFFSVPVDQLILAWSFALQGTDGVTIGPNATVFYDFNDGSTDLSGSCGITNFTDMCTISGLSALGSPTSWSLTLEVPVTSPTGTDSVTWGVNYLAVFAQAPVTSTPEPASMTLTLIAVPFLVRRLRKRS